MSTKYIECLQRLNAVNKFAERRVDLSSTSQILRLIGDPQKNMKCVHVAGTNGKGSVSLKISKSLEMNSLTSGLFTSPHLFYYGERIQVNSTFWEEDFVEDCLPRLYQLAERHSIKLTFFEYLTAMMFEYFKFKNVDVAVIECGLGGRLDATNVICSPLVSVITSIGLDHTDVLGNTLVEIAREKAGIIKPSCPTVIGPNTAPKEIFLERAKAVNSKVYQVPKNISVFPNDFNQENIDIARHAIRAIKENSMNGLNWLDDSKVERGLLATQTCRMEYLDQSLTQQLSCKHVIFDVGHNPAALEKTVSHLQQVHRNSRIRVVYGTSSQKDSKEALMVLAKYSQAIHLVEAKHFRSMKLDNLQQSVSELVSEAPDVKHLFQTPSNNGDISTTLRAALDNSSKDEIIVIIGSFFIQSEARAFFGIKDIKDPELLTKRAN